MDKKVAQQAWLADIKAGREDALKKLYRDYREEFMVWAKHRYVYPEADLPDVFQEAIIVLYNNVQHGKLTELTVTPKTYLFAVCKRILMKRGGRWQRVEFKETFDDGLLQDIDTDIQQDMETQHRQSILQKAMDKLGKSCRDILHLFYFERYRMAEISEVLGLKNETVVRSQKLRCINYLRKILKEEWL